MVTKGVFRQRMPLFYLKNYTPLLESTGKGEPKLL